MTWCHGLSPYSESDHLTSPAKGNPEGAGPSTFQRLAGVRTRKTETRPSSVFVTGDETIKRKHGKRGQRGSREDCRRHPSRCGPSLGATHRGEPLLVTNASRGYKLQRPRRHLNKQSIHEYDGRLLRVACGFRESFHRMRYPSLAPSLQTASSASSSTTMPSRLEI